MNRKIRKLLFIRSKNYMKKQGYVEPKWKLVNHRFPTKWKNRNRDVFEEAWVVDFSQSFFKTNSQKGKILVCDKE